MLTTLFLILLLFFTFSSSHTPSPPPFNASSILPSYPSSPALLKDVVEAIAAAERWGPESGVRVSKFDAGSVRVGDAQRYEFHIRVGRTVLVVRFSEVVSWRKAGPGEALGVGLDSGAGGDGGVGMVRDLELEGPIDLRGGRGDRDGELSLLLPAMNVKHTGLKQVLVGNGITVKVDGAQEVSIIHHYGISLKFNGSSSTHSDDKYQFPPRCHSSPAPSLSIHISGSASLVAYRTGNTEAHIGTAFFSRGTVELLPDKCYYCGPFKPVSSYSLGSLQSRLVLVEARLQKFVSLRVFQNRSIRLLKAKITSPTLIKFQMELERDITENDRIWKKAPEWKTKPVVECHLFDIVARVEDGGLEPWTYKKLNSPFIITDSTAWSNLMSNISFTQFPSFVVPPEALTLDVKW